MKRKDVIVALDFPDRQTTLDFLKRFPDGEKPFVKIGMELYYAEGPEIVREIRRRGHRIFLDLKLHDIPNTVRRTMSVLSRLDADMINLHAAGGSAMMKAALEGLTRPDGTRPLLIAVTQLTSTDAKTLKEELLITAPMEYAVWSYAQNAERCGLDGVVCSPLEAADVKRRCGADFLTVTPGIRFADGEIGDQKRIMTPEKARDAGCDYIVVGRPVTQAPDPAEAYRRCVREFVGEADQSGVREFVGEADQSGVREFTGETDQSGVREFVGEADQSGVRGFVGEADQSGVREFVGEGGGNA